jgi:hypothetical protein
MHEIDELIAEWTLAKKAESKAVEARRQAEDIMLKRLNIDPSFDGTENYEIGRYKVKIVGRLNRKIDADKLQEIAIDNGLTDHLSALFRWKPDINVAAWKATDESITRVLLDAITTTAGRPSFAITTKE